MINTFNILVFVFHLMHNNGVPCSCLLENNNFLSRQLNASLCLLSDCGNALVSWIGSQALCVILCVPGSDTLLYIL